MNVEGGIQCRNTGKDLSVGEEVEWGCGVWHSNKQQDKHMLQRYKIPTITLYKLQKSLQSLTPLQPDSKSCVAFICY